MTEENMWTLGEIDSAEFGTRPSLRLEGFPATLFLDAGGHWWDVPDLWPETAFSTSHRQAELDAALAALTAEVQDG